MSVPWWIAAIVVVVVGVLCYLVGYAARKRIAEREISSAAEEAKRIINESIKSAENKKRDSGRGPNRRDGSDDEFLPVRLDAGAVEESEKQEGHQAIQPDAADQSECVVSFHGTIQGSAFTADSA